MDSDDSSTLWLSCSSLGRRRTRSLLVTFGESGTTDRYLLRGPIIGLAYRQGPLGMVILWRFAHSVSPLAWDASRIDEPGSDLRWTTASTRENPCILARFLGGGCLGDDGMTSLGPQIPHRPPGWRFSANRPSQLHRFQVRGKAEAGEGVHRIPA